MSCVQAIIRNQSNTHVLIGERRNDVYYKPRLVGFPGGIIEHSDAKKPMAKGLLREIYEEVNLEINSNEAQARGQQINLQAMLDAFSNTNKDWMRLILIKK